MTNTKNTHKSQLIVFLFCLIIFCVSAVFGWNKLQYGFNFIDEGYHATESWRIANGDHFLQDKITGALMHYTLISSLIFKIYPNISLLQLRQLQLILTIASLLIFSVALFRQNRQYEWLPLIFSLFAFTGLDPIGMISNLYYQTYPHLFIVLYLSFMLFGFQTENSRIKKILYVLSGFCLWAINIALLHLGLIILAPILVFILSKKCKLKNYSFTFSDLICVLSPFAVCWILFIAVFNKAYFLNLLYSIDVFSPRPATSGGFININWVVIRQVTISIFFVSLFFILIKKLSIRFYIAGCTFLSIAIYLIINTPLFGFLISYDDSWQSKPMWFSSLLMAFSALFWIYAISKYFLKREFHKEEELSIILMVPFTICSLMMTIFSTLGIMSVVQSAIPATAAIAYLLTSQLRNMKYRQWVSIVTLVLLLGPYHFSTAQNDWNFTFFDVQPKQMDAQIKTGFGRGIRTNRIYANLYDWLIANAEAFTQPDDYAISYIVSPMVHMITKLRPSLEDTFIIFVKSISYYEKCVEKMKQERREPKIAFIFERIPALFPITMTQGKVKFFDKTFDFQSSQDPISMYVRTHMTPVSIFKISEYNVIRCYVNNNLPKDWKKTSAKP